MSLIASKLLAQLMILGIVALQTRPAASAVFLPFQGFPFFGPFGNNFAQLISQLFSPATNAGQLFGGQTQGNALQQLASLFQPTSGGQQGTQGNALQQLALLFQPTSGGQQGTQANALQQLIASLFQGAAGGQQGTQGNALQQLASLFQPTSGGQQGTQGNVLQQLASLFQPTSGGQLGTATNSIQSFFLTLIRLAGQFCPQNRTLPICVLLCQNFPFLTFCT
ncbi:uncharacterized protein LOC106158978 [Lingula anatina]|uniref:Uncharacterized protein LOC106158978 n=1 Tax=Lingula anatina TaxID=7574 RepID=A0A1S3HWZ5_LINAN|nr:uncharacterized protein LOC106158978 [Lingula anatina]XP_013390568.1 uncharacterized protein LOC106158978 [Lingula anatina]|eukprot:XP_013390567.1 uncharacterized protein LOC106158978 [Lingula anatina]